MRRPLLWIPALMLAVPCSAQSPSERADRDALRAYEQGKEASEQGQLNDAERLLGEAVRLSSAGTKNRWLLAHALNTRCIVRQQANRLRDAERDCAASVAEFRALRDEPGEGMAQNNLGRLLMATGRLDPALLHMARSLQLSDDQRDRVDRTLNLAVVLVEMDQRREALRVLDAIMNDAAQLDDNRVMQRLAVIRSEARPPVSLRPYLFAAAATLFVIGWLIQRPWVIRATRRRAWMLLTRMARLVFPRAESSDPEALLEHRRRGLLGRGCVVAALGGLWIAYDTAVAPRLEQLEAADQLLSIWKMPLPLNLSLARSIDTARSLVWVAAAAEALFVAAWLLASIWVLDIVRRGIVARFGRQVTTQTVPADIRRALAERRLAPSTFLLVAVTLLLLSAVPVALTTERIGQLTLIGGALAGSWTFIRDFRVLRRFGPVRAAAVYDAIHPVGRLRGATVLVGVGVFLFALMPLFYWGLNRIQQAWIYPRIDAVSAEIAQTVYGAAVVFRTLILPGEILVVGQLSDSYRPSATVLATWWNATRPLQPYAFVGVFVVGLFAMFLPWAAARWLTGRAAFLRQVTAGAISWVSTFMIEQAAERLFGVRLESGLGLTLGVLMFVMILYVDQHVTKDGTTG